MRINQYPSLTFNIFTECIFLGLMIIGTIVFYYCIENKDRFLPFILISQVFVKNIILKIVYNSYRFNHHSSPEHILLFSKFEINLIFLIFSIFVIIYINELRTDKRKISLVLKDIFILLVGFAWGSCALYL